MDVWSRRVVTLFSPLRRGKRCDKHAFEPSFPKVERKDQHPGPAIWAEPHDRHKVAISHYDHRCAHGTEPTQKHSAFTCRRGRNRGVQKKNTSAFDDVMGCLRKSIPKLSRSSLAIAACSGMASHGCQPATSKPPEGASLRQLKLATCTLTLPSCAWTRASSTCSWPLTGFPSSPM